MAPFGTIFISLLGISSAATASGVQNYTRHLSDVSRTLNLANVVHVEAASSAAVKRKVKDSSLEQQDDGIDCLLPGFSGSANIEDCNEICGHFLEHPLDVVTIQPLDIVTWAFRTCQFGLANLDACRSNSIQLGILASWCQGMMAECVLNGYDDYFDIPSDHMAAALTGDDAAPPYPSGHC
ncbi:hypothetical protein VTG60DRAFT_6757 [Thermothelomyces hinnuleus]